jgi:hypothetical protein
VYSFSGSTASLFTPSSSPPVIPISISSQIFMGAMRLKYSTQMAMFSSSGSSDRSSMCEPKRGSPYFLKKSVSAASIPSNQGSNYWNAIQWPA